MILGRDRDSRGDSFLTSRDHRFTVVFFGVVLLALATLYVAGYYLTSDRVPRQATVAGVSIGGLHPAAAETRLTDELGTRAARPITVTADRKRIQIDPAEAGLRLDVEATVAAAGGGRSLNPLRMLQVLTGGSEVEPVIDVDEAALDATMQRVAEQVDRPPAEGRIDFADAHPTPTYPQIGRAVDVDASGEVVTEALLATDRTLPLVVDRVQPQLSADDVDAAVRQLAEPAVSAPVVVAGAGEQVQLSPRVYTPALSVVPRDGSMQFEVDEELLARRIGRPLRPLGERPVDATVVLRNGAPVVVPSKSGTAVDTTGFADKLVAVLTEHGNGRRVELEVKRARPGFTTREAQQLRITEVVSGFTTYYPHADYRNVNLARAAEKINGTVLKPDEVFSLNGIVGERTEENGFTEGYIISDGALVEDFGGGVSQVATTLYNAAFFAGLEDVEHRPHSFYISRYPMGREATVVWGALDLKFRNNTPYGVLVEAWVVPSSPGGQGEMHVRLWSTKYWDRIEADRSEPYNFTEPEVRYDTSADCYAQTGYRGFDVDVFRHFYRDGKRVDTERWHVRYNPAPTVHCEPPPPGQGGD